MTRKCGRRSTRPDMAKLVAEIHEARLKWDATPLDEKLKVGLWHSTPGPRKEPVPDGPSPLGPTGPPAARMTA